MDEGRRVAAAWLVRANRLICWRVGWGSRPIRRIEDWAKVVDVFMFSRCGIAVELGYFTIFYRLINIVVCFFLYFCTRLDCPEICINTTIFSY